MIRFLFLNIFIFIYSVLMCCWGILVSFFDKDGRIIHFYAAVPWAKFILWVSCLGGVKVRVTGQENVDARFPRVYMTNHQSYFDIFALLAYVPVDFKFILKQELMRIPLLGISMRKAGYIGIERRDPKKAIESMDQAARKIKDGASVVIFPEGTRSVNGKLQDYKKGGFHLALNANCDIVPVTIVDSYKIVPKGSLKINKGSFYVHIGRPISIKGYRKENIAQLMKAVRHAMLKVMKKG
jgi:1-acyl-sn-glycerol-3-phosphate acyltransferase